LSPPPPPPPVPVPAPPVDWAIAGKQSDTSVNAVVARKIDTSRLRCGADADPVAVNA
jgi:hypothetical protein